MGRFFRYLFQMVVLLVVCFLMTGAVIVFDGLNDRGAKADAALVTSHAHPGEGKVDPLLDRVVQLHNSGAVSDVVVIGSTWRALGDEDPQMMVKYLVAHGIPANSIVSSNQGGTTEETARAAATIIDQQHYESVMIVADYYDVSRLKLGLYHEGVVNIGKSHIGSFQSADTMKIGNAVVTLYGYVGRVFLMPAAEKVQKEAQVGMDKATADAHQAKEKIDKGLDGLAK